MKDRTGPDQRRGQPVARVSNFASACGGPHLPVYDGRGFSSSRAIGAGTDSRTEAPSGDHQHGRTGPATSRLWLAALRRRDGLAQSNNTWVGVNFGFEVQIDERAQPDGAAIHRTGAIYSFKAATVDHWSYIQSASGTATRSSWTAPISRSDSTGRSSIGFISRVTHSRRAAACRPRRKNHGSSACRHTRGG